MKAGAVKLKWQNSIIKVVCTTIFQAQQSYKTACEEQTEIHVIIDKSLLAAFELNREVVNKLLFWVEVGMRRANIRPMDNYQRIQIYIKSHKVIIYFRWLGRSFRLFLYINGTNAHPSWSSKAQLTVNAWKRTASRFYRISSWVPRKSHRCGTV